MPVAPRSYHWTPALQTHFLAELAATGSVRRGCAAVGKSPKSAYALRRRADAGAFAARWDAAVLIAAQVIGDAVFEHAISPIEYAGSPHPVTGRLRWRRVEALLGRGRGLALVTRLDKTALAIARDPKRGAVARRLMCDLWLKSGDAGEGREDGR